MKAKTNKIKETKVSLPQLALIAGTRAMIGGGLGLLLSDRLETGRRKIAGWTLVLVGAASTVPLAFKVLKGRRLQQAL